MDLEFLTPSKSTQLPLAPAQLAPLCPILAQQQSEHLQGLCVNVPYIFHSPHGLEIPTILPALVDLKFLHFPSPHGFEISTFPPALWT